MTDQAMIELAKRNPEAFGLLYERYTRPIFHYLLARVGYHREVAEDLMQDTFFRAYLKFSGYEYRGYSYFAYLRQIAHNLLVSYYRKPRTISVESLELHPSVESHKAIEARLDLEALWRVVSRLPLADRSVIVMRYQQGLPIRNIAHELERSDNAVKLLLTRARKKLRAELL